MIGRHVSRVCGEAASQQHCNLERGLLLALGWTLLLSTACTGLPDVQPFVVASTELHAAVVESGAVVTEGLRRVDHKGLTPRFQDEWAGREQATQGLVDHSRFLAETVSKGNRGESAAQELADDLERLAWAVGMGPGVLGPFGDAAVKVYGAIARIRSLKTLEEALDASRGVTQTITEVLLEDIESLRKIQGLMVDEFSNDLELKYRDWRRVSERLDRELDESLLRCAEDPCHNSVVYQEVMARAELVGMVEERLTGYYAEKEQLEHLSESGDGLFIATAAAVRRWQDMHHQLVMAVTNKQPLDPRLLIDSAVEIRFWIDEVRRQ